VSDLADDDLMAMFSEGTAEAFDLLFDRYRVPVYNFVCSMLNDAERAEEVLQDTFLAVARSAGTYEPRGRFRAWLFRIARFRCLNRIETDRLRRAALRESNLELVDPPSREPSALDRLAADETLAILRKAILELPARQREAIVLFAFEHMTGREIGEVLDLPVNTVKTLIHRARAALAQTLDGMKEK
jgi:RNA polymerase sigma factor (sigma-70 family)